MAGASPVAVGPFRKTNAFDQVLAQVDTCELQARAKAKFLERGLPTTRHEDWKYTSLRNLGERAFAPMNAPKTLRPLQPWLNRLNADVVWMRHEIAESLPVGVTLTRVAVDEAQALLHAQFGSTADKFCELTFANLGIASLPKIWVLTVSETLAQPLLLVHDLSDEANTYGAAACFIELEAGVQAQVIEVIRGGGAGSLFNLMSTASIGARAKLKYTCAQLAESAVDVTLPSLFEVQQEGFLEHLVVSNGGQLSRHDLAVHLREPGCEAHLDAVYLADGNQLVDHHTAIHHEAAFCKSVQNYKGIAGGHSRLVFNGKVVVAKDAAETNAAQSNKSLLIGAHAEVDSKPELQIDHNNVRCSHGATVGRMSADELFYLQSRGLKKAAAEVILARAFVGDILHRHELLKGTTLLDQRLEQIFTAKDDIA